MIHLSWFTRLPRVWPGTFDAAADTLSELQTGFLDLEPRSPGFAARSAYQIASRRASLRRHASEGRATPRMERI